MDNLKGFEGFKEMVEMSWKSHLNSDPIGWLLEGEPWVRYNTLKDLLEKEEENSEVKEAKKAMLSNPQIRDLIAELKKWPSYPLKRHNDAKHPLYKLSTLADFGLKTDDLEMNEVIEKVLSHQSSEGAFQIEILIPTHFGGTGKGEETWMICDAPTTLYSLLAMGFREHEGVQRAVNHLASLIKDNGFPCISDSKLKFRGPGRKDDPCPYANLLALKALAQIPEMKKSKASRKGVEALLWHWEHQRERKLYLFGIGTDFRKLKYPFVWYDILHFADVLSRFDFLRNDERLKEIVDIIVSKQDEDGRFTPESVWMAFKDWEFGQKKKPSRWMTFLVARILKRMENSKDL
ncbi:MAG: hypothetical protein ACE5K0_10790 [Candidatus Methanofastidiosia archaeon]